MIAPKSVSYTHLDVYKRQTERMWKKETKTKTVKKLIVVLAALAVLFILGLSFAGVFRVRQVTVTGNAYYTKEEVVDLLLDEGSLQNTLLVYLRYKYQEHPEIPFIDDFEVTMDSWQSLKIRVYEKNMVGYVRYLGQDVYFDKDGIVVESSTQELEMCIRDSLSCNSGSESPLPDSSLTPARMTFMHLAYYSFSTQSWRQHDYKEEKLNEYC